VLNDLDLLGYGKTSASYKGIRFSEAESLKPDAASGAGHRKSRSASAPKGAF
jgi:hypothetical protein